MCLYKKDYIFNEEIQLFDRYETPEKFEIILRLLKILSDEDGSRYFDKINYDIIVNNFFILLIFLFI